MDNAMDQISAKYDEAGVAAPAGPLGDVPAAWRPYQPLVALYHWLERNGRLAGVIMRFTARGPALVFNPPLTLDDKKGARWDLCAEAYELLIDARESFKAVHNGD